MQFFKRIILIARNNGLLVGDPFANYKIRLKKVDRGYLTDEEITKILKKKFVSERLEHVRDIFIFSCFTGLAYIDVKNLTQENIRTSFDGNLWIMTKRQKTDIKVDVPLLKIPKMILDKYKDKLPNGLLLPILSNQKMNSYLKEIGDVCGIRKNLTFHLARHTFIGTVTVANGISLKTVADILGHTQLTCIRSFIEPTNDKVQGEMATLSGKLRKIEKLFNA